MKQERIEKTVTSQSELTQELLEKRATEAIKSLKAIIDEFEPGDEIVVMHKPHSKNKKTKSEKYEGQYPRFMHIDASGREILNTIGDIVEQTGLSMKSVIMASHLWKEDFQN